MFNFWWLAGLVNGLKPHPPPLSTQKNELLIFELRSTSDDWPGWSMDLNSLCHPSPAKNMKCYFFDYVQLLMIGWAGQWTQTPSSTHLQPKIWNAHFWIMFIFWCWPDWSMDSNPNHHPSAANKMKCFFLDYVHFWWSAWLIDELEPHLPPLSTHKNEMLYFQLCSTSNDQPSWSIDSKSICQPSPANKMKCFFLDYVYFWWSARLVDGLKPHPPPLSSQRNEMLIFVLCSTSNDRLGWWMDSNPILHLSPAKQMKCSFLYYVQLLMIGCTGWWTRTPSTTPLQPKQWNAHFCITFNIWCWPDWSMDLNPIHHPSPAKIWNAHFWVMFIFWWLVRLFDELKPHLPPLSSQ